jgi:ubiquinone/menaquinone biosynthesis C-methylase UbiE
MNESSVRKHFDRIALAYDRGKGRYSFYYSRLKRILKSLIPPSRNVFEVGCGTGDLLNCLRPARGYGFDISEKMVSIAKSKYEKSEKLKFSGKWPKEKFEYIFMSDVVEHLENPEEVFKKISRLMQPETVFVNTMANPVWEPILILGEKLRLKMPEGPHKRIEYQKVKLMNRLCE